MSKEEQSADEKRVILVFGATGQQGGSVVRALRREGWPARALVRNPASATARALDDLGVEIVRGDLSDLDSIRSAMTGVHGVFSVQPSSGSAGSGITDAEEVRAGTAIGEIAVASGVRHLVYSSAATAGGGRTGMGHLDSKIDVEEHIRTLDLASTIIRPGTFMNLLMQPGMGLGQGALSFFLRPDQSAQFVAVEDIGRVVASIFSDRERFAGRTIEIAGDTLSGNDLQHALSEAAGKPISYQRFPDALFDSDAFLGRIAALFDEGRVTGRADIVALRREFGHLLTFREWLAGPGRPLLDAALRAGDQRVAMR